MARRLVLTRAAERDLEEQVELIAAERPAVARRYVSVIVYRGSEKVVEVVRVLHSARDLTRILRRSRP